MRSSLARCAALRLDVEATTRKWRQLAASKRCRIVLPESTDKRILTAAKRAQDSFCDVMLVCKAEEKKVVFEVAEKNGLDLSGMKVQVVTEHPSYRELVDAVGKQRKGKIPPDLTQPLVFANALVGAGLADGSVAGAVHSSGDTVRSVLQTIGPAPGCSTLSSFFLMLHEERGAYVFADCAVVINPSASQLAEIAVSAACSHEALFPDVPAKVAMLSFSTKGSATHPAIDKVLEATALAKEKRPDLVIDGELQLDAAIVPSVSESKAPGSPVAGEANVLIFPNLEVGNISYKLAQRLGGFRAIGPIMQGARCPANDLSRGCSAGDVEDVMLLTCLQALAMKK